MDVKLDTSKADAAIAKQAKYLSAKELVKAGQRAVNRALAAGNTAMSKEIRQTVNLRSSTVKEATKLKRASGSSLAATITVEPKGIPLSEYGANFGKKGMTVRVKKGGSRSRIESAFAVTTKRGIVRGYEREEGSRYPIALLFGPSVRTQAERALPAVNERVMEILERRLIFEIGRSIERANR